MRTGSPSAPRTFTGVARPSIVGAALAVLATVTLPWIGRHRLRTALTLLGVVLGVQLFVTIQLLDRAVNRSFERTVETIAGHADLQLTNGSAGVAEELIDTVRALPGVANASAVVRGTFRTASGPLTIFGVDLLADQQIRERRFPRRHVHIGDELRFVNAPDSIALASTFAARAGLREGSTLEVRGPAGRVPLVVRGTLDSVGPVSLFGGAVGLVDLPTAQRLLVREQHVDEIDIQLAATADAPSTIARLRTVTTGHGTLAEPHDHAQALEGMLGGMRTILLITGALSLVVSAFLVAHAMQSALLQRRRTLALARAIGYRRGAILVAVLLEACAFGVVGAAVGLGLGIATAAVVVDLLSGAVSAIWVHTAKTTIEVTSGDVLLAGAVGILCTTLGTLGPALTTARLSVIEHLRAARLPSAHGRTLGGFVLASLLGLLGLTLLAIGKPSGSPTTQALLVVVGSVMVTIACAAAAPAILRVVARGIALAAGTRGAIATALAADHLSRNPGRPRGVVIALMTAFGFVLIVGAFVLSLRGTILAWVDQALQFDLYVSAGPELLLPAAPTLPLVIESDLQEVDGIAEVEPMRVVTTAVGEGMVMLKAHTSRFYGKHPFPVVAEEPGYLERFARGEVVVVSDNLAFRRGISVGDMLSLDSPSGAVSLPVGAIALDYTLDIGAIIIEAESYRRRWRDEVVTGFGIFLRKGADVGEVRSLITQSLGERQPVTVLTSGEFKASIAAAIDDALRLTYAIEIIAALVAGVGVITFFLAEVVDRRREIGLLRAVALDRAQLRRHLAAEAAVIGLCGGSMALVYAWPVARVTVDYATRVVSGWRLTFTFPWDLALLTPFIVAASASLAALLPARAIARSRVAGLTGAE